MVYYLGTDGAAPLAPPWNKDAPAFHVSAVDGPELPDVVKQLPHRNVVYIGSHEGCGCGFRSAQNQFVEDGIEPDRDSAADHAAVAQYIRALPFSERPIQIFGCWSGDESEPVDHFRNLSIADIENSGFAFRERELLTLENEK